MSREDAPPPRILCVDDIKEVCDELQSLLAELPARVDATYDGNAAIDRLIDSQEGSDPYRLLILDMRLPLTLEEGKEDPALGLALLTDIPRYYNLLPVGTPIIVFTQYPSYPNCVECMQAGAVDYIYKRGDPETGKSGMEILYERCKEILYPGQRRTDPLRRWMDAHIDELIRRHGGTFVALIEEGVARKAGVEGEPVGGIVLIRGHSYGEVRDQIVRNKVLRWNKLPIINVPTREELHAAESR